MPFNASIYKNKPITLSKDLIICSHCNHLADQCNQEQQENTGLEADGYKVTEVANRKQIIEDFDYLAWWQKRRDDLQGGGLDRLSAEDQAWNELICLFAEHLEIPEHEIMQNRNLKFLVEKLESFGIPKTYYK